MIYLDTSAAVKLIVPEAEREPLLADLGTEQRLSSSVLLHLELHRVLHRVSPDALAQGEQAVKHLLGSIALVPISREVISRASDITGELRSLDAIHLATALLLDSPAEPVRLVAYDRRLVDAARQHGLEASSPGA